MPLLRIPGGQVSLVYARSPTLAKQIENGDPPLAIVFTTEAAIEPGVESVRTFPDDTDPPPSTRGLSLRQATMPNLPDFSTI
jgi:hypothetical protein